MAGIRKGPSLAEIKDHLLHTQWAGVPFTELDLPVKSTAGNFKTGFTIPSLSYRTKGVSDDICQIIKDTHKIPDGVRVNTIIRGIYKIKPSDLRDNGMYREFIEDENGTDFLIHVSHPTLMKFSKFNMLNEMKLIELFSNEEFAAMGLVAWAEFGLSPINEKADHNGTLHGKLVLRNTLKRAEEKEHQGWLQERNMKELKGFDNLRVYVDANAPIALLPNIRSMWIPLMDNFAPQIKASEEVVTKAAIQGCYKIGRSPEGETVRSFDASTSKDVTSYLVKMTISKPAAYSRETYEIMRTELEKTAEMFIKVNEVHGIKVLDFDMDSESNNDGYIAGYPTIYFVAPIAFVK